MKEIELPDGSIGEYPDDISDAEIQKALARQFPPERPGARQRLLDIAAHPIRPPRLNPFASPDEPSGPVGQFVGDLAANALPIGLPGRLAVGATTGAARAKEGESPLWEAMKGAGATLVPAGAIGAIKYAPKVGKLVSGLLGRLLRMVEGPEGKAVMEAIKTTPVPSPVIVGPSGTPGLPIATLKGDPGHLSPVPMAPTEKIVDILRYGIPLEAKAAATPSTLEQAAQAASAALAQQYPEETLGAGSVGLAGLWNLLHPNRSQLGGGRGMRSMGRGG